MGSKISATFYIFLIFMSSTLLPLAFGCMNSPPCPYCSPPFHQPNPPKTPTPHPPSTKPPHHGGGPKTNPPKVLPPISRPPIIVPPPPVINPPVISPPVITPPVIVPPPSSPYPPYTPPGGGSGGGCGKGCGGKGGGGGVMPKCPINALKLGACVDVLGGLVHVGLGDPVKNVCCPLLKGLVELEAAVCLCTTIRLKLLNLNIFVPLALQVLATCEKTPPPGFVCPPLL